MAGLEPSISAECGDRTQVIDPNYGTLADSEHRPRYLQSKLKNWKAFNKAMLGDTLNEDIAWIIRSER
ncbi:hypothetical protein [Bradyrhizobium cytisi]|uniref:hypothetical protein n=1 Tax=Bradyrhizobium cytisi TaxID=515489 RepID=UPI00165319F2|nr:hypothetical protein [Bradyrhizobium cytisi]